MKPRYRNRLNKSIVLIRGGKDGVINRLLKWVIFYDNQATKLYGKIHAEIDVNKNPLEAKSMVVEIGKIHDRLGEFAKNILPYINPKLQSLEINRKDTKKYVFRVPSVIKNNQTWLDKVKAEQKLIPKFDIDKAIDKKTIQEAVEVVIEEDNGDQDIDDPDYSDSGVRH